MKLGDTTKTRFDIHGDLFQDDLLIFESLQNMKSQDLQGYPGLLPDLSYS